MKKPHFLIAAVVVCILGLPLLVHGLYGGDKASVAARGLNTVEPAAGAVAAGSVTGTPATAPQVQTIPVETTTEEIVPSLRDKELAAASPVTADDGNAAEITPLRISPDKPEVIQLDREAVNILVGSEQHLRVVPDTNRTIVLIPKQPGSTYFKALDAEGKVIMQRHVIIGAPKSNYIRIRRACANGDKDCKPYSIYYCPDMCHEVSVAGSEGRASPSAPDQAPSVRSSGRADGATGPDAVEPETVDQLQ